MVYIYIQLLHLFELLWWKANIFNYLYPRLTQVGLVYAMRQQWPSPTSEKNAEVKELKLKLKLVRGDRQRLVMRSFTRKTE